MSVNEAEHQPPKGETRLLWRCLMKANNAAVCWWEDGKGDWKSGKIFHPKTDKCWCEASLYDASWTVDALRNCFCDELCWAYPICTAGYLCNHLGATRWWWQKFGMMIVAECYFRSLGIISGHLTVDSLRACCSIIERHLPGWKNVFQHEWN